MEKIFIEESQELIDFIHQSPSPFHAVDNIARKLEAAGFEELCLKKSWNIKMGGKYFTRRNGTALVAFTLGEPLPDNGFRIIAAHSDAPTFRVKPEPEMSVDGKLLKINTETYGGAILHTWMDRPLSMAGRLVVKTDNPLHPRKMLVDMQRPVGIIPSLAIHMNRAVNEGLALNKQDDMPLLVSDICDDDTAPMTIKKLAAQSAGINADDILDFDLFLYETERGNIVGMDSNMILCPKLDDLAMAYAATKAMLCASCASNKLIAIFDNEEVGSCTKQGAGSPLLKNILERIAEKLGLNHEEYQRTVYNSFMISADMAHAIHPNAPGKHDPKLHPTINHGPVIKVNANQKYMTDADSSAIFMQLCQSAGVPFQMFVNRSDSAGGSTLGNILTSQLDIHGVDMGNPMIGMHSARETGGVKDQYYARTLFQHFLSLDTKLK